MAEKKGGDTSLGMAENVEAFLAYLLGFVTGIIFLLVEKKSRYVRFHAAQSTVLFLGLFVIKFVLGFIPILGWITGVLLGLLGFVLWIVCMIKAIKHEDFKLPIVGNIAENIA